jgi:type I restriction enzyme, S subunit
VTLRVTPAEIVASAEATGRPDLLAVAPGWSRVRLGEVARVVNGAPFASRYFNVQGIGMPLIRIRDVKTSAVSTWYDGPWETTHLVESGDLLVGMDGDFNTATWHGATGLLNQRVCRIDVDSGRYDRRFLEHALQGYLRAIWKATSSTTVKHLSSRSVSDIPLPNPPLNEQRRIVDILEDHLSRLDAANDYLDAADRRAWSLVVASAGSHVATALQTVSTSTVGAHATLIEYGTSTKTTEIDAGGVPVLRMGNIKNGRVRWDGLKYLPTAHHEFPRLLLSPGDLVFNRTNSAEHVGKCAVFRDERTASFASYLIRARFDHHVVPEWASMVINSPQGRHYIASVVSQQVGQANVNGSKLRSFPLPIPTLDEQRARVRNHEGLCAAAESTLNGVRQALARADALRRALLAAAFAGTLSGRASDLALAEEMALA